jgi:hypothetical protein
MMGNGEVTPYQNIVRLLQVVKKVLLMDSLGHAGGTIVVVLLVGVLHGWLLRLVVVTHGCVEVAFFAIGGFRTGTVPCGTKTGLSACVHYEAIRRAGGLNGYAAGAPDLRLADEAVPGLYVYVVGTLVLLRDELIVVIVVYRHSHGCLRLQVGLVHTILADGSP